MITRAIRNGPPRWLNLAGLVLAACLVTKHLIWADADWLFWFDVAMVFYFSWRLA